MHGAARSLGEVRRHGLRIGDTIAATRTGAASPAGRSFVANAWTNIGPEARQSTGEWYGAAVCAAELPSLLPLLCVRARRFPPVTRIRETPAGAAPFDDVFLVAAIPASVLPDHLDHSTDDLIARAASLTSLQEGLVFLQQLTPDERDRLARSDAPLAALADVRTPQEAMARLKALDPQRKMQVMAMFMRVKDSQRRH